jgi:hypothetical protein
LVEEPATARNVISGEIDSRVEELTAVCARCGTRTPHRHDADGVLHCRRCVLDTSLPAPMPTIDRAATERDVFLDPPRSRVPGLVLGTLMFVMIGWLIYEAI